MNLSPLGLNLAIVAMFFLLWYALLFAIQGLSNREPLSSLKRSDLVKRPAADVAAPMFI